MPNWCSNEIRIESPIRKRLEKIVKKQQKYYDEGGYYGKYGNLAMFNAMYQMSDIFIYKLQVVGDKREFDTLMEMAYRHLMHHNMYEIIKYKEDNTKNYEEFFDLLRKIKEEGESAVPKRKIVMSDNREKFAMHALLKIPVITELYLNMTLPVLNKDVLGFEGYWEWTQRTLGVKWDLTNVNIMEGANGINVIDDSCIIWDDENKVFYIELYADTAWGPPEAFFRKISKKYKVKCTCKYYEPGMVFAGTFIYNKKGKNIFDEGIDGDTIECERYMNDEADHSLLDWKIDDYECEEDEEEKDEIWKDIHRIISTSEIRDMLIDGEYEFTNDKGEKVKTKRLFKKKKK